MNYCDERSILSINADVNFHAEMHNCEVSVQPSPGAAINYNRSMEIIPKNHTAAAITLETAQAEDGIIYPMFDSGCSTVLTNSMFNCREVGEHVMSIMQAESGVQMSSTHKCRKTYYVESRDGNFRVIRWTVSGSDFWLVPLHVYKN